MILNYVILPILTVVVLAVAAFEGIKLIRESMDPWGENED